ncbi:hypothetical protein CV102_19305 [Natronococcus pandeyae]|uniref:Uncharacterized protein n=1 Tax=Natronococcus pandeyae TaxID=2055836 RepID=A0A8J8TQH8_9EURY|nr:hypothetical protein [Natronococcus pandeyae]TYL36910.1 hypothetical protein CV102_19305 [Natronococcus pandeyae]
MDDDEIASAATRFHEDVPHQFQVSLTMSMQTRERLRAIRDELNDSVGERLFTTNDVMRLALLGADRYHALASGEVQDLERVDEEQLLPLTAPIREVLEAENLLDSPERDSD